MMKTEKAWVLAWTNLRQSRHVSLPYIDFNGPPSHENSARAHPIESLLSHEQALFPRTHEVLCVMLSTSFALSIESMTHFVCCEQQWRTIATPVRMQRTCQGRLVARLVIRTLVVAAFASLWKVGGAEKQRTWKDVGDPAPGARGLARMVAYGDMAFIFGGRGSAVSETSNAVIARAMVMFDAASDTFTVLNSSAGVDYSPPGREDFGMAIVGNRIFAFGGRRGGHWDMTNAPVGDLLMFSLDNFTWTPLCSSSSDCSTVSKHVLHRRCDLMLRSLGARN
jgi:hypothetical protein